MHQLPRVVRAAVPCRAVRNLHITPSSHKNQYYFYDIGLRQPKSLVAVTQSGGRRVFDPSINASSESMAERVQKVFGSLGSREESKKAALTQGVRVLGVFVPAKPEEPTNCCQSGCINCVWELYKDELDEWRHARKKAQMLLMKPENRSRPWPLALGPEPRNRSRDRTAEEASMELDEEEDDGLSVGISTFIEVEKRLHAKKQARAAA